MQTTDRRDFLRTSLLAGVSLRIETMQNGYEVALVDAPSTEVIQLVPSSVDISNLNV